MAGHFRQKMQEALSAGQPISSEDRTHAAAAHLLGAVVGVFSAGLLLPVLATTLVLVINKSRNPYVLFHVNQAAWFQVVSSVAIAVTGLLFLAIYFVTCGAGLLLLPLLLVPWLLSVILPVWVAIGAQRGEWLAYPWLGDWVLDQESPFVDD